MTLRNLFADNDAVSPVIGVILMVAITVILAAVIGTMVMGIGQDSVSQQASAGVSVEGDTVTVNSLGAGTSQVKCVSNDDTVDNVTIESIGVSEECDNHASVVAIADGDNYENAVVYTFDE